MWAAVAKVKATIARALRDRAMYLEAHALENCMMRGRVVKCDQCGDRRYFPERCDLRICPTCGSRYAKNLFRRFLPLLRGLMGQCQKHYTLKFLTLTVRNTKELNGDSIKQLFRNTRKLMNEFFNKNVGAGGLAVLEVGKNLNIHIHLLVWGPFIPQRHLSERWAELTGGSFIVDIRLARGKVSFLLWYVLKYISKVSSFEDPRVYAGYLQALKGIRRIHTFGVFYNIGKTLRGLVRCVCGGRFRFDEEFYKGHGLPTIRSLELTYGIPSIV